MRGSELMSHPLVKIFPHVIDALLLTSAITLTFIIDQYPISHDWLTVKVVALIAYILLGMGALRWAKKKPGKIFLWALAVMTFAYIVSVALTKTPIGLMA